MNKILIGFIFLIFLLTFISSASTEEIKLAAEQATVMDILKPLKDNFEKATGITLVIITRNPKDSLLILELGHVEAALAGFSFEDWMKYMKQEGDEIKDPSSLQHTIIGEDKIKVLMHKDNPVPKLTKDQLMGILTGQITNWNEIGGDDIPIAVIWVKNLCGNAVFTKKIIGVPLLRQDISEVEDAHAAKELVRLTPGAITVCPGGMVDDTVKCSETTEIKRPVTIITHGEPSNNLQRLISFLKITSHD